MIRQVLIILFFAMSISCKDIIVTPTIALEEVIEKPKLLKIAITPQVSKVRDSISRIKKQKALLSSISDDEFVDIERLSSDFLLDIKYATEDNFLKQAVYSCAKCYVRGIVAKAIIAASKDFKKQGYKIKFFDCYRPHSVQKKMWTIYPRPGYVANPKSGSIHNRGAALDMTLTDMQGNELDMGTPFDFFGRKANHTYTQLPKEVLINRSILRGIMENHGFSIIRTEWWHYNFKTTPKFEISDFTWECD